MKSPTTGPEESENTISMKSYDESNQVRRYYQNDQERTQAPSVVELGIPIYDPNNRLTIS